MTKKYKNDIVKKIISSDGSFIDLQEDGQIWVSGANDRSVSSPGYVYNGVLNVYSLLGVEQKYKDYYAVEVKVIKHAKRLGIKKLRAVHSTIEDTDQGKLVVVKYGYVKQSKFDSLLKKRKIVPCFSRSAMLLKHSDMKWKDR
jgi:hypothetical protein